MSRRAITTVRPPQRIAEAIDCHAAISGKPRSEVIRGALDAYLKAPPPPTQVRTLYARLNSKLVMSPLAFSCSPERLREYRVSALRMGCRLSGLVSIAVAAVHHVP